MAAEAKCRLRFGREGFVAAVAVLFQLCVALDHRPRHDQFFEQALGVHNKGRCDNEHKCHDQGEHSAHCRRLATHSIEMRRYDVSHCRQHKQKKERQV
jgi:hypothetical protein